MGILSDYFSGSGTARAQKTARGFAANTFDTNLGLLRGANASARNEITSGTDAAISTLQGARDAAGSALTDGRDAAYGHIDSGTSGARTALGEARAALDAAGDAYGSLEDLARRYGLATALYGDALGLNGADGLARAREGFANSFASDFELEQGLEAINRARAARGAGTVSGGNIDRDTQLFGQNLANSRANQYLDRLEGFVAPELQATGAATSGRAATLGGLSGLYGEEAGLLERAGLSRAQIAANTAERLAQLASGTGNSVADLQIGRAGRLADLALGGAQGEIALRQGYQNDLVGSLLGEAAARAKAGENVVGLGLKGVELLKSLAGKKFGQSSGGGPLDLSP